MVCLWVSAACGVCECRAVVLCLVVLFLFRFGNNFRIRYGFFSRSHTLANTLQQKANKFFALLSNRRHFVNYECIHSFYCLNLLQYVGLSPNYCGDCEDFHRLSYMVHFEIGDIFSYLSTVRKIQKLWTKDRDRPFLRPAKPKLWLSILLALLNFNRS